MCNDIVECDSEALIDEKSLKNGWKWSWLEVKVGDEFIGENMRKLRSQGKAYCKVCDAEVKYISQGTHGSGKSGKMSKQKSLQGKIGEFHFGRKIREFEKKKKKINK